MGSIYPKLIRTSCVHYPPFPSSTRPNKDRWIGGLRSTRNKQRGTARGPGVQELTSCLISCGGGERESRVNARPRTSSQPQHREIVKRDNRPLMHFSSSCVVGGFRRICHLKTSRYGIRTDLWRLSKKPHGAVFGVSPDGSHHRPPRPRDNPNTSRRCQQTLTPKTPINDTSSMDQPLPTPRLTVQSSPWTPSSYRPIPSTLWQELTQCHSEARRLQTQHSK